MKISLKKIFYPAVLGTLLLCGCRTPEKIELLAMPGMEKQSDLFDEFFLPFSKVIKPYGSAWLVVNPDRALVFYTVFQGVQLDPAGIYKLQMSFVGQEGTHLIIGGSELSNGKITKNHVLLKAKSYLNVNGTTTYAKEFAVTSSCEQLIPSLSVMHVGIGEKGNARELLIEDLSITRVGTMKKAAPDIRKINLAADYDLKKLPLGDFKKIHKGNGPNAKRWSNIKAEIVTLNGEKVLHIVRAPGNYIYPYMNLKPFPIDPKHHFVKVTFKAKGKGAIKPGLWWKRATLNWDYYHDKEVKLTDEWQTITVIHPCMTPDVKSATMSFSSLGHGEFWIKDISANIE
ncbi:MAG: hypothetical protein IJW23_09945 [Lentisphaeria bacterium]|nr:hypothetical protein [Lentisphaeria bacterium]